MLGKLVAGTGLDPPSISSDGITYKDLIRSIATEEMGHVELLASTLKILLGVLSPSQKPEDLPLKSRNILKGCN